MDRGKAHSSTVFKIQYNHIHDFGGGITSDFGAIYTGSKWGCDRANLQELEQHCYSHAHIFNNWIENGSAFYPLAGLLYSDTSTSGTVFENNILRGGGDEALKHHCGLDNVSKNNIIHRTNSHSFHAVWTGCSTDDR